MVGRIEQLARLVIAECRRFAFAAFRFRPLDAFDRVMGDGVLLAPIFEHRGNRREPVPYGAAAKAAPHQFTAPGDDMGARHDAKFLRPLDAGEAHEVVHSVFVDPARAGVAEIGESLDFGRHVGEAVELGGPRGPGSRSITRVDRGSEDAFGLRRMIRDVITKEIAQIWVGWLGADCASEHGRFDSDK